VFSVTSQSSSSSFVLGRFSGGWYKQTSQRLPSPFNPLAFCHPQPRTKDDDDEDDWDMTTYSLGPLYDVVDGVLPGCGEGDSEGEPEGDDDGVGVGLEDGEGFDKISSHVQSSPL
jgi:hypothetical protein